jgi:hypothetical protein
MNTPAIRDVDGLKQRFPYMFTGARHQFEFYLRVVSLVNLALNALILENERHRFQWFSSRRVLAATNAL